MPALQGTELPTVVAVAEWLLEGIAGAHVLPDRGGMRIAWAAVQDYAIQVPLAAHQLREAGVLQPERAFLTDEIEKRELIRVERNGHGSPYARSFAAVSSVGLRLVETVCPRGCGKEF